MSICGIKENKLQVWMIIRWHVNYKNYKDDIILDFLANILFY